MAWHAKETVRDVYEIDAPALAAQYTRRLARDLQDGSCPPEVNRLGRTLERWHTQIVNRRSRPLHQRSHRSHQQPQPNESNASGSGIGNFTNYRIRALLYAGRPNWNLLPALTPP